MRNLGKLVLGLTLLTAVLYYVGFEDVYQNISLMNMSIVIPGVLVFHALLFILGTINLIILLKPIKKIPFLRLLRHYTISWAMGLFVPGKLGEFSIIWLLHKEGVPMGKTMAISVIDKIVTLITFAIFSIIGIIIFFQGREAMVYTALVGAILVGATILIATPWPRRLAKKLLGKYQKKFTGFHQTLTDYLKNEKKVISLNFLLTLIKWCLIDAGLVFMYFIALDTVVSIFYIVPITAITLTMGLIPITINGVGIKTPTGVFLYSIVGVAAPLVAAVFIVDLAVKYIIGSFTLAFLLPKKELKFFS